MLKGLFASWPRVAVRGLVLSMVLLGICVAYGLSPKWQPTVLASFELPTWHVGFPVGLRYTLGPFVLLNLPAQAAAEMLLRAFDSVHAFSPGQRALLWLCFTTVSTVAWWWLVAIVVSAWRRRRDRIAPTVSRDKGPHEAQ
jgi:hypothetical protein